MAATRGSFAADGAAAEHRSLRPDPGKAAPGKAPKSGKFNKLLS